MKIALPDQMAEIDRRTIEERKVPSLILMESAAWNLFLALEDTLGGIEGKRVLVVCGTGNNGGDGMALARIIRSKSGLPEIIVSGPESKLSSDARAQYAMVQSLGIPVQHVTEGVTPLQVHQYWDAVVDALLGTGSRGQLRGVYCDLVRLINGIPAPVLSVDIPSGIDPATGQVMGDAVRASRTVTFGLPQPGHIFYPGTGLVGQLNVINIGFPEEYLSDDAMTWNLLLADDARALLPTLPADASKDTRGRALIIGGRSGMGGAAALSTAACVRAGAGVVYSLVSNSSRQEVAFLSPESVNLAGVSDVFTKEDIPAVKEILSHSTLRAVGIGPGLGQDERTVESLPLLFSLFNSPVVLDADGLNLAARDPSLLDRLPDMSILTPHRKEFLRLVGMKEPLSREDIHASAQEFARKTRKILLLKGFRSVVFLPNGQKYVIPVGTRALATGGSGDVLTGIVTGILALTGNPVQSVLTGAFLHGLCGEILLEKNGETGANARDVIGSLPEAYARIRGISPGRKQNSA